MDGVYGDVLFAALVAVFLAVVGYLRFGREK